MTDFYGATAEQKLLYLKQRQGLPLSVKIQLTLRRITEWYEAHEGNVHVSFSGGKDSTVLATLVRSIYPDVPLVFVDTGLEYPEIRAFVKTFRNVVWVKPKKTFKEVVETYGYPVISKKVAMNISRVRGTKSPLQVELRMHGGINPTSGKVQHQSLPNKYKYLLDAPFKISDACCDHLKKNPLHAYEKLTGSKPFIGIMAEDSKTRRDMFVNGGCNSFKQGAPQSRPMIFWLEADVWAYIRDNNIPYCSIYDTGIDRTGCIFCMFGLQQQSKKGLNRFQLLKKSHPVIYDYCINKGFAGGRGLGLSKVLDFMQVVY